MVVERARAWLEKCAGDDDDGRLADHEDEIWRELRECFAPEGSLPRLLLTLYDEVSRASFGEDGYYEDDYKRAEKHIFAPLRAALVKALSANPPGKATLGEIGAVTLAELALNAVFERALHPSPAAPDPPQERTPKHPDCKATMCGVHDCGKPGPCYVELPAASGAEPERERDENEPESLDAALREREAMLASGMWSGPRMSYLRGFIAALSRPAAPSEGER